MPPEYLASEVGRAGRSAQAQGRPEGSLGKLVSSHVVHAAAHVHTLTSGADAMLTESDGPMDGLIEEILVSVPGDGRDQRNIISERVLGMPQKLRTDNDQPFRHVPKNLVA